MASTLIEDEKHPFDLLALYVAVEGKLVDAYSAKFKVWDASSGLPGAQLVAETIVTTGAGHLSTGRYGVVVSDLAWTPAATCKRGYVRWTYTLESGGDEYVVLRGFEVVANSTALRPGPALCLMQDVRDFDPDAVALADRDLLETLRQWKVVVEEYARTSFTPSYTTKRIMGSRSSRLQLDTVVYAIDSFRPNDADTSVTIDDDVLVGTERQNPWIALRGVNEGSIFDVSFSGRFETGRPNYVRGVWGTIDGETLGPPSPVEQIVGAKGGSIVALDGSGSEAGPLKMEMTDQHMVQYAVSSSQARIAMMSLLRDNEVRDVLDQFRGPMLLGMPGTR